jgi:hypothetical protein
MPDLRLLLGIITVLLFLILWKISAIAARLREKFPTEKEEGYDWSQRDPMGHWEAHHKDDAKK